METQDSSQGLQSHPHQFHAKTLSLYIIERSRGFGKGSKISGTAFGQMQLGCLLLAGIGRVGRISLSDMAISANAQVIHMFSMSSYVSQQQTDSSFSLALPAI